ncbi:uncharacterized protein SCHCODRAFT_01310088 [Schizophyllum commune H4-8]|uniref:uncharacterized protein n=1 Tax=Schizophyllum commune (strain H4-8 / FGSC 9210) TaxID=578458 RepID=UPI002160B6A8|nr:uncharacterized protein SCHCODRAFT_01310088 [Schizophyllum commune H4-8]KAI5891421.1 hypothetical protein SCHCODRAFT_01310088 [Schizophyllum commune H4-8]
MHRLPSKSLKHGSSRWSKGMIFSMPHIRQRLMLPFDFATCRHFLVQNMPGQHAAGALLIVHAAACCSTDSLACRCKEPR